MRKSRYLVLCLVLLAVCAFIYFDGHRYLSFDRLKSMHRELVDGFHTHPMLFAAGYFLLYIVVTALSLPGAAVLTVAGGAVFGFWLALILVSFASTWGATGACILSRFVLRDWVESRYGDRLGKINRGIERDGAFYLFTLRMIPIFPFFLINLAMGLTRMRLWTFYWVSQLGMLAGTIVFVNVGTQLAKIDSLKNVLSPGIITAFVLLGIFPWIAKAFIARLRTYRRLRGFSRPKTFDYNLVVIGAGSGGLVSAYIGAALRARTTLIERARMGGDCLNTGCVPSKALIQTTRILYRIRNSRHYGLGNAAIDFDFADIMDHVEAVVAEVAPHDSIERFTALGVRCVQENALIVDPWRVRIGEEEVTSRNIVLATGGRPAVPDIPGMEADDYLTSDSIWEIRELPARLVVVGGGPIGCELAQCFARLGSKVTIVQRGERLLPREDPDVTEFLQKRFEDEAIEIRTRTVPIEVQRDEGDSFLRCEGPSGEVRLRFDKLLIATGRIANTENLGLENVGITIEGRSQTVRVDEYLETECPTIYACGDVTGPYQFTHMASHQAWYATINALLGRFRRFRVDYSAVPWCTFTEPEVARVGINQTEAEKRGIPYEVTIYSLAELDRAIADRENDGIVKILTVPGKDTILGAAIVGAHAGDVIAEFVSAMRNRIGLKRILGTIHIYPTWAEMNKAAAGVWRRDHQPPRIMKWLERYHKWRRK